MYDLLIERIESTKKTIDTILISIQNELYGKCYTFYPNIAIAYVDDSDIRGKLNMSEHAQHMRWELSKFSLTKNQQKRILLMPDARGWAFDNIAKAVVKYNPHPDKIRYEIVYARDLHQHKCTVNPSEWDLIYVMFEAERIIPRAKNVIRGCYAAYWLENTNHSPRTIGKYFSKCKGAVFANVDLQQKIGQFIPDKFPTEIIHDAADENVFRPVEVDKNEEFTAIFVGNTTRKIKNFSNIVWVCETAGINLRVCENLPHAMLVNEYCKADICINFSTFEGGPQTFIESALCGVPMLIRNTNSLSKIIPCFTGETTEDFVVILNRLKTRRGECKAKGKEAREVALRGFTYKHAAEKFANFFLNNVNKRNLIDELTVFVIRSGNNPNYEACVSALKNQNCSFTQEEIVNVSPMSAAFQQMIERCDTPYYVQVDEDMVLDSNAIERLYFSIKTTKSNVCMVTHMLKDVHLEFNIFGIKVYKHDIMVNYPYNLEIISCEKDQLIRLEADGYVADMVEHSLGLHSPKWTGELIYERYFDLMEKWKIYKYDWMKALPRKLLQIFKRDPTDINFYALAGTMHSLSSAEPIRKREKNFELQEDNFNIIKSMYL
jgi:glycosyltransferase involved in cell wall biosynthesis